MSDSYTNAIIAHEMKLVGRDAATAFGKDWFRRVDGYVTAHAMKGKRASQREMDTVVKATVASSGKHHNVIYAGYLSAEAPSLSFKGWSEAFAVSVEHDVDNGKTMRIVRYHLRVEPKAITATVEGSSVAFTGHAAERVLHRTWDVADDALRTIARKFILDAAGFVAMGMRVWAQFPYRKEYGAPTASAPLHDGLIVGNVGDDQAKSSAPYQLKVNRDDFVGQWIDNRFATLPGEGGPRALRFLGKTFLGERTLEREQLEAVARMRECLQRHPVFDLVRMAFLFPASPVLLARLLDRRDEVESAYADFLRMHQWPEVRRMFNLHGPVPDHPPFPWEEPAPRIEHSARQDAIAKYLRSAQNDHRRHLVM